MVKEEKAELRWLGTERQTARRSEERRESCGWHVLVGLAQATGAPGSMQNWESSLIAWAWLSAGWCKEKKELRGIAMVCENQPRLASQKLNSNQV